MPSIPLNNDSLSMPANNLSSARILDLCFAETIIVYVGFILAFPRPLR